MSFKKLAAKDPDSVVPYQVDWTDYFAALDDTLNTSVVEVVNATSTAVDATSTMSIVDKTQTAAGVVTFWVAGGTPGRDHNVRCRVTGVKTSPAQTIDEVTVVIPVEEL